MRYLSLSCSIVILLFCSISAFPQLPIKATRTISFTTDEGTNMNVDISPDGKTLIFDLLGDLYTLPVTGGKATQITRGLAINSCPVWSPDGKRIAYYSDAGGKFHLHVRDWKGPFHEELGRSEPEVSFPSIPAWTADGNFVAVQGKIYALTGGKQYLLNQYSGLQFSVNGKLAYCFNPFQGLVYQYTLIDHSMTLLTSKLKNLLHAVISPDGRWVAYIIDSNSRKCLKTIKIQTNEERMLVPSLLIKYPYYQPYKSCHFAFSPDSKSLYIGYGGKIHHIGVADGTDQIIPFTAKVQADLGALDYHEFRVPRDSLKIKYTRYANASPDGNRLVFSALDHIYVMDLPQGRPHLLVDQTMGQFQPVWSPDGEWVAYVTWNDTAGGALWRVSTTNGKLERLTQDVGQYQQPAWSPDGKHIAVIKGPVAELGSQGDRRSGEVVLVALADHSLLVTHDTVAYSNPLGFSIDGQGIIFAPLRQAWRDRADVQLVWKNLEGTDSQVVAAGYPLMSQSQRMMSPNGQFIAFSLRESIYLAPIYNIDGLFNTYHLKDKNTMIRIGSGVDPHWEKGGKLLSYSYGNHYYSIDPEKIVAVAQKTMQKYEVIEAPDSSIISVNIHPDRDIKMPLSAPVSRTKGTLALKNVRVLTMQRNKVIDKGTIVIRDGRIMAVGPADEIEIPVNAKVLDLTGMTVMPGFVDLHAHLRPPPNLFPQQSWIYLAMLAYGTTTARDPASSFDSFGYGELLSTGQMMGPRLYTVGRAATVTLDGVVDVEYFNDAHSIAQKRATMGGTAIKQYLLPSRLQQQWLLIASASAGLNMTNEGSYNLIFQLGQMKNGSSGIEHSPEFGDVYKDVITFMAKSGTFFTPTLQVRYGEQLARHFANMIYWHRPDAKMQRFLPTSDIQEIVEAHPKDTIHAGFEYPARIYAGIRHQGGLVTLGSHTENIGIGVHNELWALQAGGLSNMEALQAATILGARAIGIQQDVGSIEIGKIADLLILNSNPLDNIHNSRDIRYVIKDGLVYEADTLDMVWPTTHKCPKWKM